MQVIGLYVGIATVGVFIIWYTHGSFLGIDLSGDGHTLLTYSQLTNWAQCSAWEGFSVAPFTAGNHLFSFDTNPCEYFQSGKVKATTLSLSVLVAIEMFNSFNALSEDGSLLTVHPWANPWLLLAMCISFGLHFLIIYVPFLAQVFGIVPLSFNEWLLVLVVAFPVILIDELLKFVGRYRSSFGIQRLSKRNKVDWSQPFGVGSPDNLHIKFFYNFILCQTKSWFQDLNKEKGRESSSRTAKTCFQFLFRRPEAAFFFNCQ